MDFKRDRNRKKTAQFERTYLDNNNWKASGSLEWAKVEFFFKSSLPMNIPPRANSTHPRRHTGKLLPPKHSLDCPVTMRSPIILTALIVINSQHGNTNGLAFYFAFIRNRRSVSLLTWHFREKKINQSMNIFKKKCIKKTVYDSIFHYCNMIWMRSAYFSPSYWCCFFSEEC